VDVFETGIKVIDLIAPFTKGGKTGILEGRDWKDRHYHGAYPLGSQRAPGQFGIRRRGERTREGTQLYREMLESGVMKDTVMVLRTDERTAGVRLRVD